MTETDRDMLQERDATEIEGKLRSFRGQSYISVEET